MRLPLGLRMLLCRFLLGAAAAAAQYEGKAIGRIEFEPPDQPLPRDELDRLLPFRPGSELRQSDVRTAIQRLYDTGRFSNIVVDASLASDVLTLRFITERAWFVGTVGFEGVAEPPNRGQLATAAKLELGSEFADNDVTQAVENIQERLRANGLYRAAVNYQIDRDPATEEVHIRFDLTPGSRARFGGVNLTGKFTQPQEAVVRATRWRRGLGWFQPAFLGWRNITEARVQRGLDGVRQYFQKGDHLLARVSLERLDYQPPTNRVLPTLGLDSGPVIQVRTKGAKISRGKLKQLVPIFQEHSLDRNLLVEGQRSLVEYLQSRGYFDAEVDFDVLPEQGGSETIEYTIQRNLRHKLVRLEIAGNHYFDTATLRERMYVTPATLLRFRYGRYGQKLLDRDLEVIKDLYRSNGFREVDVTAQAQDDFQGQRGRIAVVVQVREGRQWFVSKLELEGVPPEDRQKIESMLQSTEGQPFSDFNVAADRDTILNFYYNNGYPDATFDWSQSSGPAPGRVNLRFVVSPGKRQFVRQVLVRGLATTNPTLVDNRISVEAGDPTSQSRIAESQKQLYDLGIFAKVQTAIQNPAGEEESKYVLFQLDEARKYSFNAGFGAEVGRIGGGAGTSFDAPAGATGFSPRVSLGVSRINFLGLGHTLSLQTRASTLQRRGLITYLAPQFKGRENLSLSLTALWDDSRDVRTFAAKRLEGSVQLTQRLSRANTIQYRATFRRVTVDKNSLKISPELIPVLSQNIRVGSLSTTFIQDRRDDPTESHKGYYNTIDLGVALKPLGSETAFTRLLARNSTYHRVSRDLVVARTLQFGYIQRLGGLSDIPLAERFFAGGATTHRAFPENQAGPRDLSTGFPLGGKALLFHSTELRFPLIGDNLGGVLFHDTGNVYSGLRDLSFRFRQRDLQDFNYMVHSAGLGIRYRTPIGPIRFDAGLSPNTPRFFGFKGTREELLEGRGQLVTQRIKVFQFHFSLGQTF